MIETIRARLRGTLTSAEWVPLQALRWRMAEAVVRAEVPHPRVHYYGAPRHREFAIVGTAEDLTALLAKVRPEVDA